MSKDFFYTTTIVPRSRLERDTPVDIFDVLRGLFPTLPEAWQIVETKENFAALLPAKMFPGLVTDYIEFFSLRGQETEREIALSNIPEVLLTEPLTCKILISQCFSEMGLQDPTLESLIHKAIETSHPYEWSDFGRKFFGLDSKELRDIFQHVLLSDNNSPQHQPNRTPATSPDKTISPSH